MCAGCRRRYQKALRDMRKMGWNGRMPKVISEMYLFRLELRIRQRMRFLLMMQNIKKKYGQLEEPLEKLNEDF
jgi:hypothetical protein